MTTSTISADKTAYQSTRPAGIFWRDIAQPTYGRAVRHERQKLANMISPGPGDDSEGARQRPVEKWATGSHFPSSIVTAFLSTHAHYHYRAKRRMASAPLQVVAYVSSEPHAATKVGLKSPNLAEPFVRAFRLERHGRTDSALDVVYDVVDKMLKRNDLLQLNATFSALRETAISIDLALAFLTASLPARQKLNERAKFFDLFQERLKECGEDSDLLLAGLE